MVRALVIGLGMVVAGCGAPSPSPSAEGTDEPASVPPGEACPVAEQSGRLRSDTLVGLEVWSDAITDKVTFAFQAASRPDILSSGSLRPVEPPFAGASGEAVDVAGDQHVEVRFDGMLIHDEQGEPYFRGERSITPDLVAVRQVELIEAFEGVIVFVIGYDGPGCVRLVDEGSGLLTVSVGH